MPEDEEEGENEEMETTESTGTHNHLQDDSAAISEGVRLDTLLADFEHDVLTKSANEVVYEAEREYRDPTLPEHSVFWTDARIEDIFCALKRRWRPGDDVADKFAHWEAAFGKNAEDRNVAICDITRMHKHHKYTVGCLCAIMKIRGMTCENDEVGQARQTELNEILFLITRIANIMRNKTEICVMSDGERARSVQEGELDMSNFYFEDPKDIEDLRAVYQAVLAMMRTERVRRCGDDVYRKLYIKGPQPVRVRWRKGGEGSACWSDWERFTTLSRASKELYRMEPPPDPIATGKRSEQERLVLLQEFERLALNHDKGAGSSSSQWDVEFTSNSAEAPVFPSYVYVKDCTIQEYVYQTIRKEIDFDMYRCMRAKPNYARNVIDWLRESHEFDFEDINVNRNLYAFKGDKVTGEGMVLYDTSHAVYPLDDVASWNSIAEKVNKTWDELIVSRYSNVRRPHTTVPTGNDVAVKAFDEVFETRWSEFDFFKLRPLDALNMDRLQTIPVTYRPTGEKFEDYNQLKSRHDIADTFETLIAREDVTLSKDAQWDFNWELVENEVKAKDIDKILMTQRLDPRSRMTIQSMLGRALRDIKALDDWQVFLFLLGKAGSGKSTFLNEHAELFREGGVGVLNAPIEANFPLGSVHDKDVVHMPEVGGIARERGNNMLPENLLKACLSGDRVPINQKHKNQTFMLWRANIIAAGNSHMVYKNDQNSYGRRLVCAPFSVRPNEIDTQMPIRLERSRGSTLCRFNIAYLMHIVWFGVRSIRAKDEDGVPLMGDCCQDATDDAVKHLDSVYRFILESDCWELAEGECWSEKDFILEFNAFRKDRCLDMSVGWKEELYSYAFTHFKLSIITTDWQDPREADIGGIMRSQIKCIQGITRKM